MTSAPELPPAAPQLDMTVLNGMLMSLADSMARDASKTAASAAAGAVHGATLGTFQAIATLLAVRFLLLLALLGGFALSVMALQSGTPIAAIVTGGYAVLIVIPLIWLERNPRVNGMKNDASQ